VKTATSGATKRLRGESEFTVDRLAKLGEVCRLGETMLDMLLGQLTLDVGRFRDVLKGEAATAGTPGEPPERAALAAPASPRDRKPRR
jgi:hypothetical protein